MNAPCRGPGTAGCWRLRVRGRVQGVGFRPAVWRLARQRGLHGVVYNDASGLCIELWADHAVIQDFTASLLREPPPLARIERIECHPLTEAPPDPGDFSIRTSRTGSVSTLAAPDVATCPTCLKEVLEPGNRRYRHPFANCTHCGPRFSLLRELPYDRHNTSMAAFPMCRTCADEYGNPDDRRFHAQPIACPDCGPRLWLLRPDGTVIDAPEPIAVAARLLQAGKILALKGIGGFHLLADASSEVAIQVLRERKHRPHKPLALLARDIDMVRRYRDLDEAAARALSDRSAPIVLLERSGPEALPEEIAPGLDTLGFVLPMSPLHHLLMRELDVPLVFTSGNRSGQPPCTDNKQALQQLGDIADAFLLHDRDIVNRVDDSVVRIIDGVTLPLRRGRGLAPDALPLPPGFEQVPEILALGGEMKNTFCLLRDGQAILSPPVGDLEQAEAWHDWRQQLDRLTRLFGHHAAVLAIDSHPAYHSSAWGRDKARREGLPLYAIQHHHAHLAAVLAEHGHPLHDDPVLGLILDGTGYGEDGQLWGGELLLADYAECERLGRLRPTPLPGGRLAILEPWRNLAAHLLPDTRLRDCAPTLRALSDKPLPVLARMMERGINSPLASSTGRLFDAVAALLGLAPESLSYEGQAAILLEQAALRARCAHPCTFSLGESNGLFEVDPAPVWMQLIEGLNSGVPIESLALGFHEGLAGIWVRLARMAARETDTRKIVLGGGVMQNRILSQRLSHGLKAAGFQVYTPCRVPANDGGLSLGQACIAAARHNPARGD